MKKLVLLMAAGSFLVLGACKKDDEKKMEEIEASVTSGTWRVTYFNDSGTDETENFAYYDFTFSSSGTLTATNYVSTYTGTWSITDGNTSDDDPNQLEFNIYFNYSNDFADLNDDWDVQSSDSKSLSLADVSGGNGGTDLLTFTKL